MELTLAPNLEVYFVCVPVPFIAFNLLVGVMASVVLTMMTFLVTIHGLNIVYSESTPK